jgi:hypothetical protein
MSSEGNRRGSGIIDLRAVANMGRDAAVSTAKFGLMAGSLFFAVPTLTRVAKRAAWGRNFCVDEIMPIEFGVVGASLSMNMLVYSQVLVSAFLCPGNEKVVVPLLAAEVGTNLASGLYEGGRYALNRIRHR